MRREGGIHGYHLEAGRSNRALHPRKNPVNRRQVLQRPSTIELKNGPVQPAAIGSYRSGKAWLCQLSMTNRLFANEASPTQKRLSAKHKPTAPVAVRKRGRARKPF